jgi:hypothetical protein
LRGVAEEKVAANVTQAQQGWSRYARRPRVHELQAILCSGVNAANVLGSASAARFMPEPGDVAGVGPQGGAPARAAVAGSGVVTAKTSVPPDSPTNSRVPELSAKRTCPSAPR